jgi:hypothetical protein
MSFFDFVHGLNLSNLTMDKVEKKEIMSVSHTPSSKPCIVETNNWWLLQNYLFT